MFDSAYSNEDLNQLKVYSRYICAFSLLLYSLSHLYILINKGAFLVKVLSFLPLYLVFGFTYLYCSTGFIKNWAPNTEEYALQANVISASILIVIVACWFVSVLYGDKNTPNKKIKRDC